MDWLILVDLDLNMELAEGFGREMKTPRPGDGGWDGMGDAGFVQESGTVSGV